MREETGSITTWERPHHPAPQQPLELHRPCPCGCDARLRPGAAGYLLGCNADGKGVTIWIDREDVFRVLESIVGVSS